MSDYLQAPDVHIYSDEYFKQSSDDLLPQPSATNRVFRPFEKTLYILRLVLFGNVLAKYLAKISLPVPSKPMNEFESLKRKTSSKQNSIQPTNIKPSAGVRDISAELGGSSDLLKTAVTFVFVFNLLAQLHYCTASADSNSEVRD